MLHDTPHMWDLILKTIQVNLFTKQKQTYKQKTNLWFHQIRNVGGGINRELGISRHTRVCIR